MTLFYKAVLQPTVCTYVWHFGHGQFWEYFFRNTVYEYKTGENGRIRRVAGWGWPHILGMCILKSWQGWYHRPLSHHLTIVPQLYSPWHKGTSCFVEARWERRVRLHEVWVSAVWRHLSLIRLMPGLSHRFVEEQRKTNLNIHRVWKLRVPAFTHFLSLKKSLMGTASVISYLFHPFLGSIYLWHLKNCMALWKQSRWKYQHPGYSVGYTPVEGRA